MLALSAVVVCAVLGVGTFVWRGSHTDTALADPATVQLPPSRERQATAGFLAGPGSELLRLHAAAARLLADSGLPGDATACRRFVERRLDPAGSPLSLRRLAARLPDPDTGDMFQAELQAVIDVVAACPSGEGTDSAIRALRFHRTVVARRLEQVGR